MQASEVGIGCGPEVLANVERRELVPEQVGADQAGSIAAGQVLPAAVYAHGSDEGVLVVRDGEQGNYAEHSNPFVRGEGMEEHGTGGVDAATESEIEMGLKRGVGFDTRATPWPIAAALLRLRQLNIQRQL